MAATTKIIVSGNVSDKQLLNTLERMDVNPVRGNEGIEVALDGLISVLDVHFLENAYFRSTILRDLPYKSRKLKSSKCPILLISGTYSDLMVQVLKRLAYELGGGYIIEKDTNSYSRPEYKEIKGK